MLMSTVEEGIFFGDLWLRALLHEQGAGQEMGGRHIAVLAGVRGSLAARRTLFKAVQSS